MSEELSKDFFVNDVVGELFTVESQLCSTRTADLYKALDRERGRPVSVWMLRSQFDPRSDKVFDFTNRLGLLSLQGSAIAKIMTAGVDPSGVVFAVIPTVDGYSLVGGNIDVLEAERRFMAVCKVIEQLHEAGITCGDLCHNSFWIGRDGEIKFIGLMGSFEEDGSDAPVPPLDTIPYLAPEQHPSGVPTPYNDVYALGVLGYQLFTKTHPFENPTLKGSVKPSPPRERAPNAPLWIDEVILKCLEPIPSRRYQNAGVLISALRELKEKIIKEESAVTERGTRTIAERDRGDGSVTTFESPEKNRAQPNEEPVADSKRLVIVGAILAVVFVFVLGGGFVVFKLLSKPATEAADPQMSAHRSAVDPRMREAIDVVNSNDTALNEKRLKFQELEQSDDPLAHDILVRSAVDGENSNVRRLAEQAILARANRTNLTLPASTVNTWLETTNIETPPPEYEFALKTLNASLPVDGRREALLKVNESNPQLAGKILTSLVLNADHSSDYAETTKALFGQSLNVEVPEDTRAEAIIAINDELYTEFSNQLTERLRTLPNKQLEWLLQVAVQKNTKHIGSISEIAIERKIFSPLKTIYLEPLKDTSTLPEGMPMVMVRAVLGTISKGDIESVGMWLDKGAEPILLAFCADTTTEELKLEAVEYLSGRGLAGEPQSAFVKWIKRNAWEKKGDLALPLGVAALSTKVTKEQMITALDRLEGYSKNGGLFSILFLAESPEFIELVLERFRNAIPNASLVTLLAHPSKRVRLAAIRSIQDVNEVGALKAIIELYNAEVDPEVRQAYSDNLWVIRQRLEERQ